MGPLISIIIPIYNVEKFLPKCLNSVVSQSYKNIEIIAVDDGSTDESGKIADKYAQNDSRIVVLHKKNGGLSSARNAGLKLAKGKYVLFLDSDDYITSQAVEILLKYAIKENASIVEMGICKLFPDGKVVNECVKKKMKLSGFEAVVLFLTSNSILKAAACDALYERSIFNDVEFEEGRLHEDAWFKYKA